jgi:hypothetical protein
LDLRTCWNVRMVCIMQAAAAAKLAAVHRWVKDGSVHKEKLS